MSAPRSVLPLADPSRADQVFPTLTPEQIARVAKRGRPRPIQIGEVLQSAGEPAASFFLVTRGSIDIVRRTAKAQELVAVQKAGQFTGESNMIRQDRSGVATGEGPVQEIRTIRLTGISPAPPSWRRAAPRESSVRRP